MVAMGAILWAGLVLCNQKVTPLHSHAVTFHVNTIGSGEVVRCGLPHVYKPLGALEKAVKPPFEIVVGRFHPSYVAPSNRPALRSAVSFIVQPSQLYGFVPWADRFLETSSSGSTPNIHMCTGGKLFWVSFCAYVLSLLVLIIVNVMSAKLPKSEIVCV